MIGAFLIWINFGSSGGLSKKVAGINKLFVAHGTHYQTY